MRRGGRFFSLLGLTVAALFGVAIFAHAVITSASNKVILAGNSATTAFVFPFVGVAPADLTVIYTDGSGNQTTLAQGTGPTQYQVALNSPAQGSLWGLGGTVTYNPNGTPIASGTTLTIVRNLPYTQGVSLQNQASGNLPKASEQALDLIEMQIQQIVEVGNRTLTIPIVDPAGIVTTLPAAAQRANGALCFDGLGNPIACSTLPQGTVSSAMAGVVNAASLAAGRLALGLGSMAQENINGGTCGGASIQDDGSGNARVVSVPTQDAINQNVTCAFHRTRHVATTPISYTLPRANTLFSGFEFFIDAFGGAVTVIPSAPDNIQAQTVPSGTSVLLSQHIVARVWTDGAFGNWFIDWSWSDFASKPVTGGSYSNLKLTGAISGATVAALTADEVVMPNVTAGLEPVAVRQTGVTIQCNLANSGLNGVDTGGPAAANSFYSIWAISNGTTLGCLASASSSSPTMPAGFTFRKRLGWVLTDNVGGGEIKQSIQYGRNTQFTAPAQITASFGSYWTAQSVSAFVPSTASRIRMILEVQATASGGNQHAAVAPNNFYATQPNNSPYPPCGTLMSETGAVTIVGVVNQVCDLLLESTNVYTGTVSASAHLNALGWEDNL